MKNTWNEIKKIRWIRPKELIRTSLIAIAIIVITAAVFVGYDAVLGKIIEMLYNQCLKVTDLKVTKILYSKGFRSVKSKSGGLFDEEC